MRVIEEVNDLLWIEFLICIVKDSVMSENFGYGWIEVIWWVEYG